MNYTIDTQVCVIGAGHAGVEAALACSRLGLKTVIFTMNVDSIAMMPCNPHIGGSSKGHLVREIDALGGEMGKNIDKTFIQSKMLNISKGPAVHSLRTQADKAEPAKNTDTPPSVPTPRAASDQDDTLFLKTEYRIVKVAIKDIRYVEAMSEYLKVHVENEPKPIVTLLSMKKMEERLPGYFMRIHRSYIINLKMIQEVNKNRVIMDADTYLPIGDMYKEAFQAYLDTKFLGK